MPFRRARTSSKKRICWRRKKCCCCCLLIFCFCFFSGSVLFCVMTLTFEKLVARAIFPFCCFHTNTHTRTGHGKTLQKSFPSFSVFFLSLGTRQRFHFRCTTFFYENLCVCKCECVLCFSFRLLLLFCLCLMVV